MDYFLKAADESSLYSALLAADIVKQIEVKDASNNVVSTKYILKDSSGTISLDIIGTIYKETGNMLQRTSGDIIMEIPEMVALDGFHANLRGAVDISPKVEYIPYTMTEEDKLNPDFVLPEPTKVETPHLLQELLVYPQNPVRVWA